MCNIIFWTCLILEFKGVLSYEKDIKENFLYNYHDSWFDIHFLSDICFCIS